MSLAANCPVCGTDLTLAEDIQVSELLSCPDCQTLLVVDMVEDHTAALREAPAIEEDWGQ
jgi:lysine biosynthesis protein LysW